MSQSNHTGTVSTPGQWRTCTPELLLTSGIDCLFTVRKPAPDGIGHEHFVLATQLAEPPRDDRAPVTRLLRVIADRIGQGWTTPDNINGLVLDSLGVTLNFHRQAGDGYRRWVELFGAEIEGEPRRNRARSNYPASTYYSFVGSHFGLRVRVDAYVTVPAKAGATR